MRTRSTLRFAAAIAFSSLALTGVALASEPVSVPVQYKGQQIQLTGRFDKPAGAAPFPAVILLHGCTGYSFHLPHSSAWSAVLLGEGYATIILDSFTPRGGESCGGVPASTRALDVVAAAYFLASRPDIRRDKIAVMGFSHGGGTALDAAVMMGEWRRMARLSTRLSIVSAPLTWMSCNGNSKSRRINSRPEAKLQPTLPFIRIPVKLCKEIALPGRCCF
jgi:poly(3-hydroxybutyrate) depolymerase